MDAETLKLVENRDVKLQSQPAVGVYAYGSMRPMGRIRAYSAAGLTPFAGRGSQSEFHLLGHLHVKDGKAVLVEGFNGLDGERWAREAHEKLKKSELLADDAVLRPVTPLRGCQYTGIR